MEDKTESNLVTIEPLNAKISRKGTELSQIAEVFLNKHKINSGGIMAQAREQRRDSYSQSPVPELGWDTRTNIVGISETRK